MGPIKLAVTASREEGERADEVLVHVAVDSGLVTSRTPLDICCVVDVSGSMGLPAKIKSGTGQEEDHGFSILGIVRHAVKTVINGLEECDRIAVVAFDSVAKTTFELTQATESNKKELEKKVDTLHHGSGTNLWAGLEMGMELLRNNSKDRFPALLLLTDGMPTEDPAEPLSKYKDVNKVLPTIYTFGFGYTIHTDKLVNIAEHGNGAHAFIPDASFVGTAFVNALSNLMVTSAYNATLSVETENGSSVKQTYGYSATATSWGSQINVSTLQYGQSKDIVFRITVPQTLPTDQPFVRVTLKYTRAVTGESEEIESVGTATDNGGIPLQVHYLRLTFVDFIPRLIQKAKQQHTGSVKIGILDLLSLAGRVDDDHARGILQDVSGQVTEAFTRDPNDYFKKWGRHYLPSLARAHLLQQCNNFKDPGIQFYGGTLFQALRDKIEDIFVKLPPPKRSYAVKKKVTDEKQSTSSGSETMSLYYNIDGACIAGEGMVRMQDGSSKRVDEIVKGDAVEAGEGEFAEVKCVVKTKCVDGTESLVKLPGGARVTPYHPIRTQAGWKFPIDIASPERHATCGSIFNFVLASHHSIIVNGAECVTLGHNLQAPVVHHPYFGTQQVINDLQKMKGWGSGLVELFPALVGGKAMVRDPKTRMVIGFAAGVDGIVGVREP